MEPLLDKRQEASNSRDTDQFIGDAVMYLIVSVFILLFFLPALAGLMLFTFLQFLKREFVYYLALLLGFSLLFMEWKRAELLSYFGFIRVMHIPFLSTFLEKTLHVQSITSDSFVTLIGLVLLFTFGAFVFATFFWKKRVITKHGQLRKRQKEAAYQTFRKKRIMFLDRKQTEYRSLSIKEAFIGYTDLKQRVSIGEKELNYHMLATGGTGTGKTTLIAALMESALRQQKPVIFMDGKGERRSMLEFKALCESYGRKVYLFSEMDNLTYNPLKNGTPTETRDKIMSLLSFSSEGDGAYYTDIASRFLQLVIKLLDEANIPRDFHQIARLSDYKRLQQFFTEHSEEKQIEEEFEETEELIEEAVFVEDDLSTFLEGPKVASAKTEDKKRTRTRKVMVLQEGLKKIKQTLEDEFPKEIVESCLTRLRMQVGELLESDLGHLFIENDQGIDLRKITDEGDVVIFSLSGSRYGEYIRKIGKMVILDVNSLVAYRQATGRKSIFGVYDEFSAYGDRRIVDIVNKSRSAGFECIISTQTLSDLDSIDPIMTEQIITNCNIIATGRVNSSKDAERIAQVFGTYSDQEITQQIEKKLNRLRYESEMGTVRQVERFKAHPSDIKNLQIGEIFLTRKMVEEKNGSTYFSKVYVRNALDLGGIR
jgi:type IV secretory pathway TraG/TraD family ATPase VirD4